MVKVSITLANNAQITVEAEESEVAHGVVGMVLRELPRDLVLAIHHTNGAPPAPANGNGGNNVAVSPQLSTASNQESAAHLRVEGGRELTADSSAADSSFSQFCRSANPLGDMRRVVAAAEGARRFLGMDDVDEETLGRLFDLAGWRRPHSFTQTLRNAGRSSYRWLERVPGRAGRYTVTPAGRAALQQ
ncbi:MAG: hypothetical protein EXR46_10960 [Dehalococcoidia bacterium]|nr:hypothetical protein [Dehalococcoidia bacterium]